VRCGHTKQGAHTNDNERRAAVIPAGQTHRKKRRERAARMDLAMLRRLLAYRDEGVHTLGEITPRPRDEPRTLAASALLQAGALDQAAARRHSGGPVGGRASAQIVMALSATELASRGSLACGHARVNTPNSTRSEHATVELMCLQAKHSQSSASRGRSSKT
jgi:hypothetical protein